MSIEYTCLGASSTAVCSRPNSAEDPERLRRPAVDSRPVRARSACRRSGLLLEGVTWAAPSSGPRDREPVRDAARDPVPPQDEEAVLVAARRRGGGAGGDLERRLPAGRHVTAPVPRSSLRRPMPAAEPSTYHVPPPPPASLIATSSDRAGRSGRDGQVAGRERLRIREDQRRVGGREIREPGALDEDGRLDRAAVSPQAGPAVDISADFTCCGVHERVSLEQQRGRAGDVRRREARPVEDRVLVARVLGSVEEMICAPGAEMSGLSLWPNGVRPAGREARRHAGPGRRDLRLVARDAERPGTAGRLRPPARIRAPSRSEIVPPGMPSRRARRRVAGTVRPPCTMPTAPARAALRAFARTEQPPRADERDRAASDPAGSVVPQSWRLDRPPVRAVDRAHVDQLLVAGPPRRRDRSRSGRTASGRCPPATQRRARREDMALTSRRR